MRRSANSLSSMTSLTSLTSISSVNSRTKIYNTRDFHKYIANIEEDIIKVYNYYYYLSIKYDKKIDNIINRYEHRTNKLFMDLRRRESHHNKLSEKVSCIIEALKELDGDFDICDNTIAIHDADSIDKIYRNIVLCLWVYTLFVIGMIISTCIE